MIQDPKFLKLQWLRDRLDDLIVTEKVETSNGVYRIPKRVRKVADDDEDDDSEVEKPAEDKPADDKVVDEQ